MHGTLKSLNTALSVELIESKQNKRDQRGIEYRELNLIGHLSEISGCELFHSPHAWREFSEKRRVNTFVSLL